jgi:hypothetical protein
LPPPPWKSTAEKTLSLANYWHVKNYFRSADATTGHIVTIPATLELGDAAGAGARVSGGRRQDRYKAAVGQARTAPLGLRADH